MYRMDRPFLYSLTSTGFSQGVIDVQVCAIGPVIQGRIGTSILRPKLGTHSNRILPSTRSPTGRAIFKVEFSPLSVKLVPLVPDFAI